MARRKKEERRTTELNREALWDIIKSVKIPILTLDEHWNTLFAELKKRPEIKKKVKALNDLLKEQGGTVNKVKEMKVLKKKLMTNIIDNMSETEDEDANNLREKKQDANQRLIRDINGKIDESSERLLALPYEIMDSNRELLMESIIYSYSILSNSDEKSQELADDIERLSIELDEKIKEKEFVDKQANAVYSYMHDIVGGDILERIDTRL